MVKEDLVIKIGRRIRSLRQKKGWTQTYMAVHLGLDRSYLSDIERGKRELCLRNMEVIAIGFDLTPSQLLKGL